MLPFPGMTEDFLHLQQIHVFSSQYITASGLKSKLQRSRAKVKAAATRCHREPTKACITSRTELAPRKQNKCIQHHTQE
jgi:hypothetical protein